MKKLIAAAMCAAPFALVNAAPNTSEITVGYENDINDGKYISGGVDFKFKNYESKSITLSHSFDEISKNLYPKVSISAYDSEFTINTTNFDSGLAAIEASMIYGDLKNGVGTDLTFGVSKDDDRDSYLNLAYDFGLGDGLSLGVDYLKDLSVSEVDKEQQLGISIKKEIFEDVSVKARIRRAKIEYTDGDELESDILSFDITKTF